MLVLRPNCELCDKELPPDATDACICSYECTFCTICVETILHNVCPNCGGDFSPRPVRPAAAHRPDTGLRVDPASDKRVTTPYSLSEIQEFVSRLKHVAPTDR